MLKDLSLVFGMDEFLVKILIIKGTKGHGKLFFEKDTIHAIFEFESSSSDDPLSH